MKVMKNKAVHRNLLIIVSLSVFVCGIHAVMLHTQFNHYVYTSALKAILFTLCPFLYCIITKSGRLRDLFVIKEGGKKLLKLPLLSGLSVFALVLIAHAVFQSLLDQAMVVGALLDVGITSDNYVLALLYVICVNAALEEMFFRGFVFLNIHRMGLTKCAHIFSSLLFALYHVSVLKSGVTAGVLVLGIFGLAVSGFIFNELARRCESVVGSLIVHICANAAIGVIGVYYL